MSDKKDTPAPAQPAAPAPAKPGEVKAPAAPAKGGVWNVAKHFAYGGFAGMVATCCIQPIDMVKVRIQLLGEGGGAVGSKSPFAVAKHLIKTDGFLSLYKGLSAGLLRQATYSTARLGIWKAMTNAMTVPGQKSPFWQKAMIGLTAGGVGSVFGTPCDVALIRMQADATLPPEKRRNYKNVIDALVKIVKQEGFNGMFKGNVPVVIRAMSLNFGQLATYDEAMEQLRKYSKNDEVVKTGAKLISGFFASFCSLPFDFIKTRMQKQVKGPDGQYPYRNIVHATSKIFKQEGAFVFYRGFWTYYVRIAPHTMITLFVLEQIEQWEKRKAAATGAGKK